MAAVSVRSLEAHEQIIESGMRSFLDVGRSLLAIREEKLYLEKAESFEEYCKKRWGFAKSHAYRLIESAEVVDDLVVSPIGGHSTKSDSQVLPENERQARALADSSDNPRTRATVWAKAVEVAPKNEAGDPVVTAALVKKVAAEIVRPAKPKPAELEAEEDEPEDEPDPTIEEVIEETNRKIESFCRGVMKFVEDNMPEDKWLKDLGRGDTAVQKIRDACSTIRTAKCHCACPMCKGEGCAKCHKTGRVPKYNYDQMGVK